MYSSLSKLLQQTQASAAKKLGALENAMHEDQCDPNRFAEKPEPDPGTQPGSNLETKDTDTNPAPLSLKEFKIW